VNIDIFCVMRLQVLLTFVLFVAASATCPAQNRQLRYIAGYPNYNLIPNQTNDDWNVAYTSAILKQQGDSLVEVKILCDSMHKLYYLRYYYNRNSIAVLIAGKKEKYGNFLNDSLTLLTINPQNLNTTLSTVPSKMKVDGEEYNFFPSVFYTLDIKSELKYALEYSNFNINNYKNGRHTKYRYYLLDANNDNRQLSLSTKSNYQYIVTNGSSIGPYLSYNGDSLPLQSDTVMNLLRIPSEQAVDSIFRTPLPPNIELSKHGAFVVIEDAMLRVLYFYEYAGSVITLHIYQKKESRWSKLNLPSSGNNKILIANFGGWLAGALKVKNERGALILKKNQPGQEFWSRARTKYSPSIYEILEAHEPLWYSERILYIYNVDTKTYIQWDTKQADSEILLVENDKVYYRKYDEIYEVPIVKGKSLGKHRLVVKNKYVPAIHFMFMTKGSK